MSKIPLSLQPICVLPCTCTCTSISSPKSIGVTIPRPKLQFQLPPPKPFQLPTSQLQHELNPPKAPQPRPAKRFNTHVHPPDHITSKTLPHHPRVHNHSPHNGPQARMARHPPRLHRQTRREKLCARVRPKTPQTNPLHSSMAIAQDAD